MYCFRNKFITIISKTTIVLFLILIFAFTSGSVFAQSQSGKALNNKIELARKHYSAKEYSKSAEFCKQTLALDSNNYVAHRILAEIFNEQGKTDLEIFHLLKAEQNSNDTTVFFNLGEAYLKSKKYSESLRYYNKYSSYRYIPEKRKFELACKMASCRFLINGIKNKTELGSSSDDPSGEIYWPILSDNREKIVFQKVINNTIPSPVQDSTKQSANTIKPTSGKSGILFFSGCNLEDGIGSCDIYFSRYENGKWSVPINAGNNLNTEFWEAQPFFDTKSSYLYFSSDRNGGNGNKDIWRAKLLGFSLDGSPNWKKPENLGSRLNTSGDELAPYFHNKNQTLYFASDNHAGLGGMDLFGAAIVSGGQVGGLDNLGYPINTTDDEFGVTMSTITDTSFFAVGRDTKKGTQIFAFNHVRGLRNKQYAYAKAIIADVKNNKPVQANIELVNTYSAANVNVDENGEAIFHVSRGREYTLNVTKEGYLFYSQVFSVKEANSVLNPFTVDIKLRPIEIGAEIELYNIYYESGSYEILEGSEAELQKLVSFLKNNQTVKVEIQGHTDNVGDPENNMNLSNLRAKSVVDYLKQNRVELSRLKFAGYGDTRPIQSNETEVGRQANRRTTVKILEN